MNSGNEAPSGFNLEDFIQIVIGSSLLIAPIAFSEEAWRLSESLPLFNVFFIMVLSLLFLGLYVYQGIYSANIKNRLSAFIFRIFIDYVITLMVVVVILFALDKLPLSNPDVLFKRIVLIAFPASLVGVVVDGLDKE